MSRKKRRRSHIKNLAKKPEPSFKTEIKEAITTEPPLTGGFYYEYTKYKT